MLRSGPTWFVYLTIGALAATALGLAIYYAVVVDGLPRFIGVSLVESVGDDNILLAGCDNKTIDVMMRKFTGTTIIAHGCPIARSMCSEFICNSERTCEEVKLDNVMCSEDFDCLVSERCDATTCSCVPDGNTCTMDSQCLNINMTAACTETFCDTDEGQCKTRYLNETFECETNSNCPGLQICQDCGCIDPGDNNSTLACVLDTDCTDFVDTSDCVETFCNVTTARCATRFIDPLFDCDGSCPPGQACQDCVCSALGSGGCVVDTDCTNFTDTSGGCIEAFCNAGRCQTRYEGIGNCDSDAQCSPGQTCSECMCTSVMNCETTGYLMSPLTPPVGFSCGLDVAIFNDLIVALCTDDPLGNGNINIASWLKSGATWNLVDNIATNSTRDNNDAMLVPAIDMDDGTIAVLTREQGGMETEREVQVYDIDSSGIITLNAIFDALGDSDSDGGDNAGDICVDGDNIVAVYIAGGNPPTIPYLFQFDGMDWSLNDIGGLASALKTCDMSGTSFVAAEANSGASATMVAQVYSQFTIDGVGLVTDQEGWETYSTTTTGGTNTNSNWNFILVESNSGATSSFSAVGYNPIAPQAQISTAIAPVLFGTPPLVTGEAVGSVGGGIGTIIQNRRTPMASFGSNALIGNLLCLNSQLSNCRFISVTATGLTDPVLISSSLWMDQPAYAFAEGPSDNADVVVLANFCESQ